MNTAPTLEEVLGKLRDFKEARGGEFRLVALGVFGSVARGEADEKSDIDIVFEAERPNYFLTAEMRGELEDLMQRHVDVVRIHEGMRPRFRERILRDAQYV